MLKPITLFATVFALITFSFLVTGQAHNLEFRKLSPQQEAKPAGSLVVLSKSEVRIMREFYKNLTRTLRLSLNRYDDLQKAESRKFQAGLCKQPSDCKSPEQLFKETGDFIMASMKTAFQRAQSYDSKSFVPNTKIHLTEMYTLAEAIVAGINKFDSRLTTSHRYALGLNFLTNIVYGLENVNFYDSNYLSEVEFCLAEQESQRVKCVEIMDSQNLAAKKNSIESVLRMYEENSKLLSNNMILDVWVQNRLAETLTRIIEKSPVLFGSMKTEYSDLITLVNQIPEVTNENNSLSIYQMEMTAMFKRLGSNLKWK